MPSVLIVPIAASPPVSPFTAQRTAVTGAPASVATKATRPFTRGVTLGGVTARSPRTRNARLDVDEPWGDDVTVIGAVVAPAGTVATSRFGAAATSIETCRPNDNEFC